MARKVPVPIKAFLLAVFLYIAIPTIDDIFSIGVIYYFLNLNIFLIIALYYGIAWAIVYAIEAYL